MGREALATVLLAAALITCVTPTSGEPGEARPASSPAPLDATPAPSRPEDPLVHEPLTGTPLRLDLPDGVPQVQVLLRPNGSPRLLGGPPASPVAVARTAQEFAKLGVEPVKPVDFTRWIAVVPTAGQGPAPASVITFSSPKVRTRADPGSVWKPNGKKWTERSVSDHELEWWLSSVEETQVLFTNPCARCGGASGVQLSIETCLAELKPRVYLVSRPTMRLVVGVVDSTCDHALP